MKLNLSLICSVLLLATGCGGDDGGSNPVVPPGGGTNHAPTVNLNIDNTHLAYGGLAQLTASASDTDGDQVTFTWSAVLGAVTTSGPTSTTATLTAGSQWGQASVTVIASDGKGGTAQATALTYIRNPNPPSLIVAATTSQCGADAFGIQVTAQENLSITLASAAGYNSTTECGKTQNYSPPLIATAGVPLTLLGIGGASPICIFRTCNATSYSTFYLDLHGTRPEPDGGAWTYHLEGWRP